MQVLGVLRRAVPETSTGITPPGMRCVCLLTLISQHGDVLIVVACSEQAACYKGL